MSEASNQQSALMEAQRGSFSRAVALAREAPPTATFRWAVHSLYALASNGEGIPDLELFARLPEDSAGSRDHLARVLIWRAALQLDPAALERIAEGEVGGHQRRRRLAELWVALLSGRNGDAYHLSEEVIASARSDSDAEDVIVATALRGLAHERAGDHSAALATLRRAVRMARSEGIRNAHYLASLLLARARRRSGLPFLANRILSNLRDTAPASWTLLIDLELGFASGTPSSDSADSKPLTSLLRSIQRGDPAEARRRLADLREVVRRAAWLGSELAMIERVLFGIEADADPEIVRWCHGVTTEAPLAILGLAGYGKGASERTMAIVHRRADGEARRLLRPALPLLIAEHRPVVLSATGARTGGIVAAALFSGRDGLSIAQIFEAAYGFKYVARRHANSFAIALHRAREALPEGTKLIRTDTDVKLTTNVGLIADDPRCTHRVEDRVLSAIASSAEVSAADAAAKLGISVRLCQLTLTALRDQGVCDQNRHGRRIAYSVEDTTFAPPTDPGLSVVDATLAPRAPRSDT